MAARWVTHEKPPKGVKECTPAGFARGGAVYADPIGLALLQGKTEDDGCRWNGQVVITEGGKDYLTWAARAGRVTNTDTFAVLGVWAGAWTHEIAARIPDGATVIIRTDQDETGDKYAEAIAETLHGRCELSRTTRERYAE